MKAFLFSLSFLLLVATPALSCTVDSSDVKENSKKQESKSKDAALRAQLKRDLVSLEKLSSSPRTQVEREHNHGEETGAGSTSRDSAFP